MGFKKVNMNRKIVFIYTLVSLTLLTSCLKAPTASSESSGANMENPSISAITTTEQDLTETGTDITTENTSFQIRDYDNKPQSESIGVFFNDNFYGWISQIRDENEINSYIAQGEYIGESKEKQIVYQGSSDEQVVGADDWYPDSDLECNGLNAGTPLYSVDNYIVAVYDTPVMVENLVAHNSDGAEEDIVFYVYGHIYRMAE